MISSSQRPLPDNTQHSQRTDTHAQVGFEPTVSAGEQMQTYALDRVATWIFIPQLTLLKIEIVTSLKGVRNFTML